MRPVNLLPPEQRPRTESERQGGANLALGLLGALLIAVVAYVLMANAVTSHKNETARANREANQAEASAGPLKGYADFAKLKETRESSVKQVAAARFDWEGSMRELARLLPSGVWLKELDASPPGEEGATGGTSSQASGGASSQAGGGAAAAQAGGPTLTLSGCARSQRSVATMLVRLRALRSAADVSLADSSKPGAGTGASGGSSGTSGAGSSAGGAGDCGQNYSFNANIALRPSPSGKVSPTPAASAGGAK
jgi:Tfp pilus assembly protein PilN